MDNTSPIPTPTPLLPGAETPSSLPEISTARVLTCNPVWPLAARIAFPYVFVYVLLYSLTTALGLLALPFGERTPPVQAWNSAIVAASGAVRSFWQAATPWVGANVLRLEQPITIFENGSGDTTHNYVQVLCYAVIALVLGSLWHIVWRRPSFPRLWDLLTIYMRFVLAVTMLGYGLAKVFPTQMPAPSAERLLQPYGNSSPMGLLWTFIGASAPYQIFCGAAEVLGGLLLFWRHTTTLGALVLVGVLVNVAMLNYCYDVPVKLYSTHLLAMALLLVAPHLNRLLRFFVLNRAVEPATLTPPWATRWLRCVLLGVKIAFVLTFVGTSVVGHHRFWRDAQGRAAAPLVGSYTVEEFTAEGAAVPPLLTDATRWRRVFVSPWGMFGVLGMNDAMRYHRMTLDEKAKTLTLTANAPPNAPSSQEQAPPPIVLHYDEPEPGTLVLTGAFDGREIAVRSKRVDESSFLLVSRGFRWINEYPFNR